MTQQDWPEFCRLIQGSDEATTGKCRSETAIGMMFTVLAPYELKTVKKAVAEHMRKSPFMAKASDIITVIDGSDSDRSVVAWQLFLRAIQRHGRYESVRFPDPAFHYAIMQLGGWIKVASEYGDMSDREVQFREKDWRQTFEIGLKLATWDNVPPYLWGIHESNNREGNFLDCLPAVVDVVTGRPTPRDALERPSARDVAPALPEFTPKGVSD